MNLVDIMPALAEPFPVVEIDFLPKSAFERDGQTFAAGMPFADKRAYEDRLNRVAPGEWSSQAQVTVAADRIIAVVTVTICGTPHTDVGEAFLTSSAGKREENPTTEAFAQAFKRACSQAGLGRYLYDLPKQYIPFDKAKKRWDLSPAALRQVAADMYRKAGLPTSTPAPAAVAPAPTAKPAPAPTQPKPVATPAPAPQPAPAPASELPDNAPVPRGTMVRITELARAQKKKIARPANYGEAKRLLAELQPAS